MDDLIGFALNEKYKHLQSVGDIKKRVNQNPLKFKFFTQFINKQKHFEQLSKRKLMDKF